MYILFWCILCVYEFCSAQLIFNCGVTLSLYQNFNGFAVCFVCDESKTQSLVDFPSLYLQFIDSSVCALKKRVRDVQRFRCILQQCCALSQCHRHCRYWHTYLIYLVFFSEGFWYVFCLAGFNHNSQLNSMPFRCV